MISFFNIYEIFIKSFVKSIYFVLKVGGMFKSCRLVEAVRLFPM